MAGSNKNIAASVHRRLLSKARESSRPFNELLQYFAIERFIYRLSKNPHADRFILKGALMFWAWSGSGSRPTMDIDLLGKIDNSLDVIVPGPGKVAYPALLDFPAPELNGYTMESTIAEKFHAMVKLGILNSRMKDFYDIWLLSRTFDFKGEILAEAVGKTFENRNTPIPIKPTVFNFSFVNDHTKKIQWQGFIRKAKLSDAPESFEDVVAATPGPTRSRHTPSIKNGLIAFRLSDSHGT